MDKISSSRLGQLSRKRRSLVEVPQQLAGMDDHARLQALLAQSECETLRSDALANTYCFSGVCETEFMALIGRFSRARKGSPETALQFLREDVAWRNARFVPDLRLKHPREVLGVDPKEVAEYYERRLLGMDVAGRPVYYVRPSRVTTSYCSFRHAAKLPASRRAKVAGDHTN